LFGIPVVTSPAVCVNNSTSGYYDGSTTDRTQMYLVNRSAFALGTRRAITVETDKTIASGIIEIVTTWRGDSTCLYATTESCANAAINISYTSDPE